MSFSSPYHTRAKTKTTGIKPVDVPLTHWTPKRQSRTPSTPASTTINTPAAVQAVHGGAAAFQPPTFPANPPHPHVSAQTQTRTASGLFESVLGKQGMIMVAIASAAVFCIIMYTMRDAKHVDPGNDNYHFYRGLQLFNMILVDENKWRMGLVVDRPF